MRRTVLKTAIVFVFAALTITAVSATEFYLAPDHSGVQEFCNNTTVELWLNATEPLANYEVHMNYTCCCANITGYVENSTYFVGSGGGYCGYWTWTAYHYGPSPPYPILNVQAGLYHLGNITIHCCNNTSTCCMTDLHFQTNLTFDEMGDPVANTADDGTYGCGYPDLVVDIIDPKYIFAGLNNSLFAKVTNQGVNPTTGPFNVSVDIRDASDVQLFTNTVTFHRVLGVGESTNLHAPEIFLGYWTPAATPENITITVTADCNDTETECNETNNARVEYRNTTGDCKTDTMLAEHCYGYAGNHPLTEVYSGTGGIIYTIGDHIKYKHIANFTIGPGGDTNQVDGGVADIPPYSQVTKATLYVYYGWKSNAPSHDDDPTDDFEMSIDGGSRLIPENYYTDCKNFSTSYTYYQYGAMVYDVTANVTEDGTYQVVRSNYASGKGSTYAMSLMVTYDNCNCTYSIAHGYDRLATLYWGSSRWQYYVSPEDATTTATLPDVDPGAIVDSRWMTIAIDVADGTVDSEYQKINNCPWEDGAWLKDAGSYLSFDRTSGCISDAGTDEVVSAQEGWKQTGGGWYNGIGLVFACLQTKAPTGDECLGDCYSLSNCTDLLIASVNCSYCINNLSGYWHPDLNANCFGVKTPWDMCLSGCTECCDGIDNLDEDLYVDYPADPECTCGLDPVESTQACPVPELSSIVLLAVGLVMLVGLVRFRRKD